MRRCVQGEREKEMLLNRFDCTKNHLLSYNATFHGENDCNNNNNSSRSSSSNQQRINEAKVKTEGNKSNEKRHTHSETKYHYTRTPSKNIKMLSKD